MLLIFAIFLLGYSDGTSLRSAALDVTHGGECLQGLKLAFQVVSNTPNPTTGTGTYEVSENQTVCLRLHELSGGPT